MNSKFSEIIHILQNDDSIYVNEQLEQQLFELVSFDELVDDDGDTLIHYWFKHTKEFPKNNFKYLLKCFFACDHVNKISETPLHVFLKYCPEEIQYFQDLIKCGCSLFKLYGSNMSIFENIFIYDQNETRPYYKSCFEFLITRLYERAYMVNNFNEILSYTFKYKSINILSCLLNNFRGLFEIFLQNVYKPFDKNNEAETTAKQLFLDALTNSNREIFDVIFKEINKCIVKNMLYCCTNREFCLYLSEHVISKLEFDINTKGVDPKIMALLVDLTDGVYKSRLFIHEAAERGDIDLIRKMSPIMLDSVDYRGDTPLLYAIKNDRETVALYLVESDMCDFCHLGSETTPLHLAAQGRPGILRKMFFASRTKNNISIDVNILDKQRQTPLVALFKPPKMNATNTECIRILIDNGADISLCDTDGCNILDLSIKRCVEGNVINLLIERGLKPSRKGEMKFILIHSMKFYRPIVDLLLEKFGVDIAEGKEILTSKNSKDPNDLYIIIDNLLSKNAGLDFFFDCFEKAVENDNEISANTLLDRINGLRFYTCGNKNVLSVLSEKTGHFRDLSSPIYSIYKNVFNGITEENKDFYLFQDEDTGDNFIHVALYKNNKNFLNLILDTYSSLSKENKENKTNKNTYDDISDNYDLLLKAKDKKVDAKMKLYANETLNVTTNENAFGKVGSIESKVNYSVIEFGDNAESLKIFHNQISLVFRQQNSKRLSPIELAASRNISLKNVFPIDIFFEKPSADVLLEFLTKVRNPNISDTVSGIPLLLFYLSHEEFSENDILRIMRIFSDFKCDFSVEFGEKNAAKICFDRDFFEVFKFILNNGGILCRIEQICNYIETIKNEDFTKYPSLQKFYNEIVKYFGLNKKFVELLEHVNKLHIEINNIKNIQNVENDELPFIPELEKCFTLLNHFHTRMNCLTSNFSPNSPISKIHSAFQPYVKQIIGDLLLEMYKRPDVVKDSKSTFSDLLKKMDYFFTNFGTIFGEFMKAHPVEEKKKELNKIRKKWADVIDYLNLVNIYSYDLEMFLKNKEIIYRDNYTSRVIPKAYRICDVALLSNNLSFSIDFSNNNKKNNADSDQYKVVLTNSSIVLLSYNVEFCNFLLEVSFKDIFYQINRNKTQIKIFTLFGLFEIEELSEDKLYFPNFNKIDTKMKNYFEKMDKKLKKLFQKPFAELRGKTIFANYVDKNTSKVELLLVEIDPERFSIEQIMEYAKKKIGDQLLVKKEYEFLRISPYLHE